MPHGAAATRSKLTQRKQLGWRKRISSVAPHKRAFAANSALAVTRRDGVPVYLRLLHTAIKYSSMSSRKGAGGEIPGGIPVGGCTFR